MDRTPIRVFSPSQEWQGELILQRLREAGIHAYLANRSTFGFWGGGSPAVRLEILVPHDQAEAARSLISEFLAETSGPKESDVEDEDQPPPS
jgi:hypothetical protein